MMAVGGFLVGVILLTACLIRSNRASVTREMAWLRAGIALLIVATVLGVFWEAAL